MPQGDISLEIRTLSNLIRRDIEKSCAAKGDQSGKGVQGWAIDYFYENRGQDVFQKDFEERFSIRRSTASNILKSMEKAGYIERMSVAYDARLKKIVLTDRAVHLHEEIAHNIRLREQRLRRGLTESEIDAFFAVMKKLEANMEEEHD